MSYEVQGQTAEKLEAGTIFQGCWQGSKLRVAYSLAGMGHLQKEVGTLKRRQVTYSFAGNGYLQKC